MIDRDELAAVIAKAGHEIDFKRSPMLNSDQNDHNRSQNSHAWKTVVAGPVADAVIEFLNRGAKSGTEPEHKIYWSESTVGCSCGWKFEFGDKGVDYGQEKYDAHVKSGTGDGVGTDIELAASIVARELVKSQAAPDEVVSIGTWKRPWPHLPIAIDNLPEFVAIVGLRASDFFAKPDLLPLTTEGKPKEESNG